MTPEVDHRYRAAQVRDVRFSGRFFIAAPTSGIFCQPTCPSAPRKPANCQFFGSAGEAVDAGFRPCSRCRPEIAADRPASRGTSRTISRALKLIDEGALDESSVEAFATQLGIGERHLRRLMLEQLGASPTAIAQMRRLNVAKQLIVDTKLSMLTIALSAGFTSVRRFNSAIRNTYGRAPTALRHGVTKTTTSEIAGAPIVLRLPFAPPYNFQSVLKHLKDTKIPGVEHVGETHYRRTICISGAVGLVEVLFAKGNNYAQVTVLHPDLTQLQTIVARIRRMFDLDADSAVISSHLARHSALGSIVTIDDGLRIPGAWNLFELAVRMLIGRHMSGSGANQLRRLVETFGTAISGSHEGLSHVFPDPATIVTADLTTIGMTEAIDRSVVALASMILETEGMDEGESRSRIMSDLGALISLDAKEMSYLAMRAFRDPDAFALADGVAPPFPAASQTEKFADILWEARPWSSYAALQLLNRPTYCVLAEAPAVSALPQGRCCRFLPPSAMCKIERGVL